MSETILTKLANWLTGGEIFEFEADASLSAGLRLGQTVKAAITAKVSLTDADLRGADLTRTNLTGADLRGADLTGADLTRTNLTDADLTRTNLTDADLRSFRADFFDVLLRNRAEIPGLLAALDAGQINGSTYTGDCACLVGTIANVRGCDYESIEHDAYRPIEVWFQQIRPGQTPENHGPAKVVRDWIVEFQALIGQDSPSVGQPDRPAD